MSERSLMLLSMAAASFISTINVDSPDEMLSLAPTRVNILSTTPIFAPLAGTKLPTRYKRDECCLAQESRLSAHVRPVIIIIWQALCAGRGVERHRV